MLDATKSTEQRRLLEYEPHAVGIRFNKTKPDAVFKQKTSDHDQQHCQANKNRRKDCKDYLSRIHNCDVMIREDITVDEFTDVLLGTRKYIPCLYVYNKVDAISLELMNELAHQDHTLVISCEMNLNIDYLLERIWGELGLVKVYTKKRGEHPDLSDPICLRKGATIERVCHGIHRSLAEKFKYALVWVSLIHGYILK
ncbi:developmentally-regulated GTP-binding protein 2 [Ceratobasidium sp. AG-Ba]|nr:developmentally-regulated GTP-binding protein 2 [Ceratobasidium sp. AG-Ba]